VLFWVVFDFMTVFTGLYALAILPPGSESPYLDLAQQVLPPLAQGLFIVSLFAIVMSTVDSFSFISALTIGKDLSSFLCRSLNDKEILLYTRWGLLITAILSILLAMVFENAVDIWYMVGSFVVPALLIPLIASLYRLKLKNVVFVMIIPVIAATCWYSHGVFHPLADGSPGYILGLEPMYPGVLVSLMLYLLKRN
jgi:SSS family solute:Na+ symporter